MVAQKQPHSSLGASRWSSCDATIVHALREQPRDYRRVAAPICDRRLVSGSVSVLSPFGVLFVRATTCACAQTPRDQPNRFGSCGAARRRVDAARQTCSRRSRERARSRGATSAPVHRVSLRAACLRIDRLRARLPVRLRSSARANDTHRGGLSPSSLGTTSITSSSRYPSSSSSSSTSSASRSLGGALRVPTESKP